MMNPNILNILRPLFLFGAIGFASSQAGELTVGESLVTDSEVSVLLDEAAGFIDAPTARATYGVSGAGLSAAIIDTGIYDHTALNFVGGYDFVDNDGNPVVSTGSNHGTHVAGIVGSSDSTYQGIAPGADIVSLRVLDDSGNGSFAAVNSALQWVIDNHAAFDISVVNMSLGNGLNYSSYSTAGDSIAAKIATLMTLDIPVVVSAGNDFYTWSSEQGMSYPAIIPDTISVGSVWDQNYSSVGWSSGAIDYNPLAGQVVSHSQRLSEDDGGIFATDIFAPGAMITSTVNNNTFADKGGTSMASPMVAGAILLAQELYLDRFGVLPEVADLLDWMTLGGISFVDEEGTPSHDNVTNTGDQFTLLNVAGMLDFVPLNSTMPLPSSLWLALLALAVLTLVQRGWKPGWSVSL